MAKQRYYFFGDLRLWKTGLWHDAQVERLNTQSFMGVDQERVLMIPTSPNYKARIDVMTYFDTHPAAKYLQRGMRAIVDAINVAILARGEKLHPLVYVDDGDQSRTVLAAGPPIQTNSAHNYIPGDNLLIRRAGVDQYSIVAVVTTPAADTFTYSGGTHVIQAGDDIHLIEASWTDMVIRTWDPPKPKSGGDYEGEAKYMFEGEATTIYDRTTVDLDA